MTSSLKLRLGLLVLFGCGLFHSTVGARLARRGAFNRTSLLQRSGSKEGLGAVSMDTSLQHKETGHDSDHCLPHMTCKGGDCCSLGTSCNTCPHGFVSDTSKCGWKGLYRCKEWGQRYDVCQAWDTCKAGDCCAWGTSCNTCPHGFVANSNECAGRLEFRCKDWSCTPLDEDPHGPDNYTPCCEGLVKELVDSGDDRRGEYRWHYLCKNPTCNRFTADCPNGYKKKDNLAGIECTSGPCSWADCCDVAPTPAPTPAPADPTAAPTTSITTSFTPPAGCPWDTALNTKKDCISKETGEKLPEICCERLIGCQNKLDQARNVLDQRIAGYVTSCHVSPNDVRNIGGEWAMTDKTKVCSPACQESVELCDTLDSVNWEALSAECSDVPQIVEAGPLVSILRAVDTAWTSCPGTSHPCTHH